MLQIVVIYGCINFVKMVEYIIQYECVSVHRALNGQNPGSLAGRLKNERNRFP